MKRLLGILCALALTVSAMSACPMTASAAMKGDVNGDGQITTSDVRKVMLVSLRNETPTQKEMWWGDFNVNGEFDTTDARMLLHQVITNTSSQAAAYSKPTGTDWWGEKSISLLGDSISFGVGTSNSSTNTSNLPLTKGGVPEQSYVSFVKKAVQWDNNGALNYGFTSAYPTAWPGKYRSDELHAWPDRSAASDGSSAWVCDNNDNGERLTSVGMTSTTPWSTITYTLRKDYINSYSYFCIYYHTEPGGAYFAVADGNGGEVADVNGSKAYMASDNNVSITKRTAFYRLADCPKDENGCPQIIICHDGSTKPFTVTGIGYYKDISGNTPTFNAYTRGGMSLVNVGDYVLQQATSSDTFILALGYNDFCYNHTRVNNGEFKAKIDRIIELCKQNGTHVIVNDYAWNNPVYSVSWTDSQRSAHATVKSELRRCAYETGGVYVDQQALLGDEIIDDLNTDGDGVHPSNYGHKLMAGNVIEAMGVWWTEEWK